jgi:hypothetical protein
MLLHTTERGSRRLIVVAPILPTERNRFREFQLYVVDLVDDFEHCRATTIHRHKCQKP